MNKEKLTTTYAHIDNKLIKRTNVAAVVMSSDKKFLYCQRAKTKRFLPEVWHLPGGKVETNESYDNALARELKEELSIDTIVSKKLPYAHLYSVDSELHQTIFFLIKAIGKIKLDFENQAYKFLKKEDLPLYLKPHVLQINEKILDIALASSIVSEVF